jgi:hypothetical protein
MAATPDGSCAKPATTRKTSNYYYSQKRQLLLTKPATTRKPLDDLLWDPSSTSSNKQAKLDALSLMPYLRPSLTLSLRPSEKTFLNPSFEPSSFLGTLHHRCRLIHHLPSHPKNLHYCLRQSHLTTRFLNLAQLQATSKPSLEPLLITTPSLRPSEKPISLPLSELPSNLSNAPSLMVSTTMMRMGWHQLRLGWHRLRLGWHRRA